MLQASHNADLSVSKLPSLQFPSGAKYFSEDEETVNRSLVVAVHNNFIVGHGEKKQRFIKHGLWSQAPQGAGSSSNGSSLSSRGAGAVRSQHTRSSAGGTAESENQEWVPW